MDSPSSGNRRRVFALILVGTVLLMLPFASAQGHATPFMPAFFTATSAVSLTGLVVVDTGSHWSFIGQAIVILLIQVGGLGIMSLTALTGMLLTGRINLHTRVSTAAEGRPLTLGGIKKTLLATLYLTLAFEVLVALTLSIRFATTYHMSLLTSLWEGTFHAVSAFNNAGFGLRSDSLISYASDAWILLPLAGALIIGGIGYPVLMEILIRFRNSLSRGQKKAHRWSVTASITLLGTLMLIIAGTGVIALLEWHSVLSDMPTSTKWLTAFFQGVSPRTAGFNSVDYAELHPTTLMATDILMFIGGGSAGTAGGIKITTTIVLIAAVLAEFKGSKDVSVRHRRIPESVVRQALAVAASGIAVVSISIGAIRVFDPQFDADRITFEVFSAFATVGLSTGITADLSAPSQLILCAVMYLGRVGPMTLVAALAAKQIIRHFHYPVERPYIG